MTNDEEADEIIRRLQRPPARRLTSIWTIDSLSMIDYNVLPAELSKAIADAIDAEVLEDFKKLARKL